MSPYRPFVPESGAHLALGPFDWVGALEMLRASVAASNQCQTVAITDRDTSLPGPTFHYVTTSRRLMAWILEVSHAYVTSPDFDQDTFFLSPDMLVFGPLQRWVSDEALILVRRKFPRHPILNGLQFWPVAQKAALSTFFARARDLAQTMGAPLQRWGGDTEPLRQLLMPLVAGSVERAGVRLRLVESQELLQTFTTQMLTSPPMRPFRPVLDFRYLRKRSMRVYFDATLGAAEAACR